MTTSNCPTVTYILSIFNWAILYHVISNNIRQFKEKLICNLLLCMSSFCIYEQVGLVDKSSVIDQVHEFPYLYNVRLGWAVSLLKNCKENRITTISTFL